MFTILFQINEKKLYHTNNQQSSLKSSLYNTTLSLNNHWSKYAESQGVGHQEGEIRIVLLV